jgi:hypothetical protein
MPLLEHIIGDHVDLEPTAPRMLQIVSAVCTPPGVAVDTHRWRLRDRRRALQSSQSWPQTRSSKVGKATLGPGLVPSNVRSLTCGVIPHSGVLRVYVSEDIDDDVALKQNP